LADRKLLDWLRKGKNSWNAWRQIKSGGRLDLRHADLRDADLSYVDLREADLSDADLRGSNLIGANLHYADLRGASLSDTDLTGAKLGMANLVEAYLIKAKLIKADLSDTCLRQANMLGASLRDVCLSGADLNRANLSGANLSHANLSNANLSEADLSKVHLVGANLMKATLSSADLQGADLTGALLSGTILANNDLTNVIGLETCEHFGPSTIDFRTLERSNSLPLALLRGVGLPDSLIDYLPSLLAQPIQYYSCFISYSGKDDDFAKRLHADLQSNGVRCWFAPHDLPIGGKILDEIDVAIRLREKLLVILSEHSIRSEWVEDEVKAAYEQERKRGRTVLFPLRLDDALVQTDEAWATKLRRDRNVGDFRRWKDHDQYQASFKRVLRDLTAESRPAPL
jgi:uncharacterized protein YjbI with pentapeptide repeats